MKTILATVAILGLTAGIASAQQAGGVLGFGSIANTGAQSVGGTTSTSIALPGAGLTFGSASNDGTATGFAAVASGLFGTVGISGGANTNDSVTAAGSLGTAGSIGAAGGASAGGGDTTGFGGIGLFFQTP